MSQYSDEQKDTKPENPFKETPESDERERCYAFTWNNYPEDHKKLLAQLPERTYMIYGYETCPKTGTPHLQGFCIFRHPQRIGVYKSRVVQKKTKTKEEVREDYFDSRTLRGRIFGISWGKMYEKSSPQKNREYCKKMGNYVEQGDVGPGQGARIDLNEIVRDVIVNKLTEADCYEKYPTYMVRMERGMKSLISLNVKPRDDRPMVLWLFGKTGTGKSEYPETEHGRQNVYRKIDGKNFWNNYKNEQVTVIEEFQPKSVSPDGWDFRYLLQLLDKYSINVELKGSSTVFNSPFVYITCQYPPDHYYQGLELDQLLRRITNVYEFTSTGEIPQTQWNDKYYDPAKDVPIRRSLKESVAAKAQYTSKMLTQAKALASETKHPKPSTASNYSDENPNRYPEECETNYSDES